jgi:branched-chain amino acid transport system substrate-binding protein
MDDAALLIKQSKEMNKSFTFFGISTLYDKKFIEITKNAANGIYLTAPFFSVKSDNDNVNKFVSKYKFIYKKDPDVWAGYGYDALNIIVKVLSESKSKKIEPYKAMEMLKDYNGVTGLTTINADHSINKQFNIVQVKDNDFQIIK